MKYRLDASTRVVDDGAVVIGGSPLTLFRVSAAGAAIVRALETGGALPTGHETLTDRLLDAGALHPDPERRDGPAPDAVTAVIPVRSVEPEVLRRLVDAVRAEGVTRVVVVDDASPVPIAPLPGADLVRLDHNAGPGGARNEGAERGDTAFLVFLDADTRPRPGWLAPLLAHLVDPRVGLVAPRVVGAGGRDWLARFEAWRSPLDLGPAPARVRAGSRVSYVPAAALVVRVAAWRAVGGFDAALRFGEDVDLVWRLDEAGWRARYEPAAEVEHETRPDLRGWLRQRFDYGTSAAPLAERHPGALAPVRVSGWSAVAWGLGTLVSAPIGLAVGAGTTAALAAKLRPIRHPYAEAARLAGLGNLFAGRILAAALTRAWWPFAVTAGLVSRRARRVVIAAAVLPGAVEWARDRPRLDPVRALTLRLLDDVSYGAGVWVGAVRHHTLAPLRPDLRNWPGPRRKPGLMASVSGPRRPIGG